MPLALTQLRNTGQNLGDLVLSSICRLPARPAGREELVIVTWPSSASVHIPGILCQNPPRGERAFARSPSPSVLILRAVRTRAKSVALKVTVPSLLRGMFMPTSLCAGRGRICRCAGTRPSSSGPPHPLWGGKGRLQGRQCGLTRMHS